MALLRKKLEAELDRTLSLLVRKETPYCVICGSRRNIQAGHIIKRGKKSTKWLRLNVHTQCAACNLRHNYYPEHYINWFVKKYGADMFERLVKVAAEPKKFTIDELKTMLEELKQELKQADYKQQCRNELS